MSYDVICISHATGAGGEEVGRRVAETLSFLYVDEEIISDAAAQGGITPSEVADEERRKSLATRLLNAIAVGGIDPTGLGGTVPLRVGDELRAENVRALIRETIVQTAARGDVVIAAHAASHALDGETKALRVLVTASTGLRQQRVGERQGLAEGEAARAVRDSDAARRDYLKRFYRLDEELPTHYDLVLNTDRLSIEDAADIISRASRP